MNGTFVRIPEKCDNIEQAIENALSEENFLVRPIARERLRKTNEPFGKVIIDQSTDQISILVDSGPPIITPADGRRIKWKKPDGEELLVNTKIENGELNQIFIAKDGKRIDSYRLSPDGQELTLVVTTTSDQLKLPLNYTQMFKRSNK
jgi:hypothetical protein